MAIFARFDYVEVAEKVYRRDGVRGKGERESLQGD
jgi:hypothetical protein